MKNLLSAAMFDFSSVSERWYIVLLVTLGYIAVLAVIAVALWLVKKRRGESLSFETRDITYGGVCLAITVALSIFPIYSMPYGGSVTVISLAPIMIYCYYFGFHKGLVITTTYMLINLMQGPYIINPFSLILDYLLPYSALAIVGIAPYSQKRYAAAQKNSKNELTAHFPVQAARRVIIAHWPIFVTSLIYIIVRFSSHVLAGVLWYYDIDLATKWGINGKLAYSMAYNHFAIVDYAVAMIAVTLLLCSKSFNTVMTSHRNTLQNTNPAAKDDKTA